MLYKEKGQQSLGNRTQDAFHYKSIFHNTFILLSSILNCRSTYLAYSSPTAVELYATESGQKFQQFLIRGVHPTHIGVSDFLPLIKGAGFFTNASNEWEPITCTTTNVSYHCKPHV